MNKPFASYFLLFASYFFDQFSELSNDEKIIQPSVFQIYLKDHSILKENFASYLLVTC